MKKVRERGDVPGATSERAGPEDTSVAEMMVDDDVDNLLWKPCSR
jgi:hypothetical protein